MSLVSRSFTNFLSANGDKRVNTFSEFPFYTSEASFKFGQNSIDESCAPAN